MRFRHPNARLDQFCKQMLPICFRAVLGLAMLSTVIARAESFTFVTAAGLTGTGPGLGMTGDGTNSSARFNHPYGITTDTIGNLYVTDAYNSTIRKISPVGTNWVVLTLAGLASNSGTADGTNTSARFNGPTSLTIENGTNIYVA